MFRVIVDHENRACLQQKLFRRRKMQPSIKMQYDTPGNAMQIMLRGVGPENGRTEAGKALKAMRRPIQIADEKAVRPVKATVSPIACF